MYTVTFHKMIKSHLFSTSKSSFKPYSNVNNFVAKVNYQYNCQNPLIRKFSDISKTKTENNLEEYFDPARYDFEYGHYKKDFNLFLNLKTSDSTVLDLACGTGRLSIPLQKKGFKVTGLDISSNMLEYAKSKSNQLPINYIQGDIRNFQLNKKFDLIIMAGNSFQALLTKEEQCTMFKSVQAHLKQKGLFAFNTRAFIYEKVKSTNDFEYWHEFYDQRSNNLVKVFGKQSYDPKYRIVTYTTKRVEIDKETITKTKLLFTPYIELIGQIKSCGFEISEVYGNVDKTPYSDSSPAIIPICHLGDCLEQTIHD